MNPDILQLFFTPLLISKESYKISEKEMNFIQKLKKTKYSERHLSESFSILNEKSLLSIKEFILKHIDYYAYEYLKINKSTKFYITKSWVTYSDTRESHPAHSNPNSVFSGVFYFKSARTPIKFSVDRKDFLLTFQHDYTKVQNSNSFMVFPHSGMLVLFPSNLKHEVPPNESSDQRISLAFNTFAYGNIGENADNLILINS